MTGRLAMQLVIATAMAALTVVMHLLGLSVLIAATNRHSSRLRSEQALARQMLVLVGVSFGLFILHGIEIWSYATLYFLVGATLSFADALYFSTATYATISAIAILSQRAGESWGRLRALTASSSWGGRPLSLSQLSRGFAPLSTTGPAHSARVHDTGRPDMKQFRVTRRIGLKYRRLQQQPD